MRSFKTLLATLLMFTPAMALAEQNLHPYLTRKHMILAGVFFQEAHAEIRETWDPLPPVAVNLGLLGVDGNDNAWIVEYRGRLSERWGVVASAQSFSSQGTRGNTREFNFGGATFPVGAQIRTEFDVDTYLVDLVYHAWRTDHSELSVGLGVHAFDFKTEVTASAFAGGGNIIDRQREESVGASDLLAPLPNVRLSYFHAFSPRVSVGASTGWLSANIDEWDGRFLFLHLRGHYLLGDHFGVSVGYQYTDVDVTRDRGRKHTEYDVEFRGPTLQLTYGF